MSPTNRQNPRGIRYRAYGRLRDGPRFPTGYGILEWLKQFNRKPQTPAVPLGPRGPKIPKHLAGGHTYMKKPHYWPSIRSSPVPPADQLDPLLHKIEAALIVSGESQTKFGVLAVNDVSLVGRMRRGMHVKKAARRARIEARIALLHAEAAQKEKV